MPSRLLNSQGASRGFRAALLGFGPDGSPWRIDDGLLAVGEGRILDLGQHAEVAARNPGLPV
ncbi:MAG: hypothetical protein ACLGII_15670, partial [Gammaproteobacteria bacterium]